MHPTTVSVLVQGRLLNAEDSPVDSSVPTLDDVAIRLPLLFDTAQVHERLNCCRSRSRSGIARDTPVYACNANEAVAESGAASAGQASPLPTGHLARHCWTVLYKQPVWYCWRHLERRCPYPSVYNVFGSAEAVLPDHLRVHVKLLDRSAGYARFDLVIA